MSGYRIESAFPYERGESIPIFVDGEVVMAYEGETVGALMFALDRIALRRTRSESATRGVYCGMGVCYECLITVNATKNIRACITQVSPGMTVETSADNTFDEVNPQQNRQCDEC